MPNEKMNDHQIIINRLERERAKIQKVLDESDGLTPNDARDLAEISLEIEAVETKLMQMRVKIDRIVERLKHA